MRIGLVGGTGKEGSGLAMRWARAGHQIQIGSRSEDRGRRRAQELSEIAGATIVGGANDDAIRNADIIIVCVPYDAHRETFEFLRDHLKSGQIIVDITVPLKPPKVRRVHLPDGNSAALEAQAILGKEVKLAAGIHHVSSTHLTDLEHPIDCDILVCSDDRETRKTVINLVEDLGTRGLDAGVLANSVALEALTPVLIHMNITYKSGGTGIRITGL